jgi:hypothetical protein
VLFRIAQILPKSQYANHATTALFSFRSTALSPGGLVDWFDGVGDQRDRMRKLS